jgi:ATP-dependent Clp protease protease subunit
LRELTLNGYIDDEVWFGDEITPDSLHESLYGADDEHSDDVHIRLNSYGGSCNAAVRMFDDVRAYPGAVNITVSGTAASAATMLCMAADRLEMTPGSLFMIHDPSMMAFGNERDLTDSINLLRAAKESILNMYERRVRVSRSDTADMMAAATWMDAKGALERGFVDAIVDDPVKYPVNAAEDHTVFAKKAEEGVRAWFDRKKKPTRPAAIVAESDAEAPSQPEHELAPEPTPEPTPEPDPNRVKIAHTDTRLEELKY